MVYRCVMFAILKLIKPFLLPPTAIFIGLLAVFYLLVAKKWKWARIILVVVLIGYYLLSTDPVAYLLVRSLERMVLRIVSVEAAPGDAGKSEPEVIVILAGGVGRKGRNRPRHELQGPSWRRLWHGIEIYRECGGRVPILYSGGSGNPFDQASIEAELAREYALSMGVPASDFWIEAGSRNTYENVREMKRILDQSFPGQSTHQVILVTSSSHMLRSVLVMLKAGLDPIPSPADFPIVALPLDPLSFLPSAKALMVSSTCLHEWIGIISYRLMGRL